MNPDNGTTMRNPETAFCLFFYLLQKNSTDNVRKWCVAKRTHIDPDDVKELAVSDSLETRTYFVAVDHVSRSVVISIRGTYSFTDTMVDLLCDPVGEFGSVDCGQTEVNLLFSLETWTPGPAFAGVSSAAVHEGWFYWRRPHDIIA